MGTQRAKRIDTDAAIGKSPMSRGREFRVGEHVANGVITKIMGGPTLLKTRYELHNACCGSHSEITYTVLRKNADNDQRICIYCANAQRNRGAGFKRQRPAAPPPPLPGSLDARGVFWPHLGRLGPRWSAGEPQRHIGQGRAK